MTSLLHTTRYGASDVMEEASSRLLKEHMKLLRTEAA